MTRPVPYSAGKSCGGHRMEHSGYGPGTGHRPLEEDTLAPPLPSSLSSPSLPSWAPPSSGPHIRIAVRNDEPRPGEEEEEENYGDNPDQSGGIHDTERMAAAASSSLKAKPPTATPRRPRLTSSGPGGGASSSSLRQWKIVATTFALLFLVAAGALTAVLASSNRYGIVVLPPFLRGRRTYINTDPGRFSVVDDAAGVVQDLVYDGRPYIVMLGDSITEFSFNPELAGFSSLLANTYNRFADIKNRGVAGYTTRDTLKVLDLNFPIEASKSLVRALPPKLVVVFLGANDAVIPGSWKTDSGEDHHVPVEEYKRNLEVIVAHLRRIDDGLPLILVTPPPVVADAQHDNAAARRYADTVIAVGQEQGVPALDLWVACEGDKPDVYPSYLIDGLHLNERGNRKVYEGIMRLVESNYGDLMPGARGMPKQEADPWY